MYRYLYQLNEGDRVEINGKDFAVPERGTFELTVKSIENQGSTSKIYFYGNVSKLLPNNKQFRVLTEASDIPMTASRPAPTRFRGVCID